MKYLGGLAVALLLTACGGGSPESINAGNPPAQPKFSTMAVSIVDSTGKTVSSIALDGGYSVRATYTGQDKKPIIGKALSFSIQGSSIALLAPETALTDATGTASVSIVPTSVTSVGAATVTVTASEGTSGPSGGSGGDVSGSRDFSVQAANIALSPLRVGSATLASGGNTSVAVTALLGGVPASGTPVTVSFSASCGRINNGVANATTSGSGVATAVYTAVQPDGAPCSGVTTLTANTAGASAVSTTVTVAAPVANAITFVSAAPQQVFIAGSGAVEQAQLTFKVFSSSLAPIANQAVEFRIVTNPGDVGLSASGSVAPVTGNTDSNGEVTVSIFAGTIPGPVKVRASLPNTSVFAESQNITVASGPPAQSSLSLSVETFNIEGANLDGTRTRLTARVADRQGNAVEDGTVVNFTAEGGQVERSCATARANNISSCSVVFETQDPRPVDGRVSVLAYTEGTKDYIDKNGNNRFDSGIIDTLLDIGDAYRDDNENGIYEKGEFLIPRGGEMNCAGSGAPAPARINTCTGSLSTTVRKQATILFSSSNAALATGYMQTGKNSVSFRLSSANNQQLPVAAGSIVTAAALDNTPAIPGESAQDCSVQDVAGSPVANVPPGIIPGANLSTLVVVTFKGCEKNDLITLKVKSPSGLETTLPPFSPN